MTTCWEKIENSINHPEGFEPKQTIDEVKKTMIKANDSKIEDHGWTNSHVLMFTSTQKTLTNK